MHPKSMSRVGKHRAVFRSRRTLTAILIAVILAAFVNVTPLAAASTPRIEKAACRFEVPPDRTVECGYLIVPEVRNDPESREIRLHYAVFKALSATPRPDPIIYLEGGPGGSALLRLDTRLPVFAPYMADRDFIFFDQRGTGYSEPSLQCREVIDSQYANAKASTGGAATSGGSAGAVAACRNRLLKAGVRLEAYNSRENAADVDALRRTLGYKSWNLYGISYGTRLALNIMRDFPRGIRSAVLDSSYPTDVNLYGREFGTSARRAINLLFASCEKDPECNVDYPNLRRVYREVTDQLNRKPAIVPAIHPRTGELLTLRIDGGMFHSALVSSLYTTAIIPSLPGMIYDARNGDYSFLGTLVLRRLVKDEFISQGMYFSVMCADRNLARATCRAWGVEPQVPENPAPVRSAIPTLIFAGEYDPVTPPSYGERALRTLLNGYLFEFPGYGHGISPVGQCAPAIMLRFLDNPNRQPESLCLTEIGAPDFMPRIF